MKLKPITTADYSRLRPFFDHQPHELCAYSLPSITAWTNEAYQPFGGVFGDTLVVSAEFTRKKDMRHLILPLSPGREFSPRALFRLANDLGHRSYGFVPQQYLDHHGLDQVSAYFTVAPHDGFDDYVYRAEDLALLKGNKYSKKRNLIHQFRRSFLEADRVRVETISAAEQAECIDFIEEWCEQKDCGDNPDDELACEKKAVINTLTHLEVFDVKGILVRVDGFVSALGIGARLTDDMGVLHFEKAFPDIKGLYQYLDQLCAQRLFKGYTHINKESDMGEPSLKKAKKSYYPVKMIRSYKLTVR